jgi:hypothetical protein
MALNIRGNRSYSQYFFEFLTQKIDRISAWTCPCPGVRIPTPNVE